MGLSTFCSSELCCMEQCQVYSLKVINIQIVSAFEAFLISVISHSISVTR